MAWGWRKMKEKERERKREPWGSLRDAALSCKSVRSLSLPGGMVAYVKAGYTPRDEWTLFRAFLLLTPWTCFCTLTCRWLCTREGWPACVVLTCILACFLRVFSSPLTALEPLQQFCCSRYTFIVIFLFSRNAFVLHRTVLSTAYNTLQFPIHLTSFISVLNASLFGNDTLIGPNARTG